MKWLLVLGAGSDIARATSHHFAREGWSIYLAGRNLEELEKDAADLSLRTGAKALAVRVDALDYPSHQGFYDSLPEKPLGVLCAVGYLGDQDSAELNFEESSRIIATNFTGCVSLLNVVANDLKQHNQGFVIGISSVAGDRGRQSNYTYGSAKAGMSAWLSGLRNRLVPYGVHVLTVKPGFVATAMTEGMDLPAALTAQPEQVARDIFKAVKKRRDVLYTRWFWRYIMLIIRVIPERIFKRLKL